MVRGNGRSGNDVSRGAILPVPDGLAVVRRGMTADLFADWLRRAPPGARLVYHRGHLAIDRDPEASALPEPARAALADLAGAVWAAAGSGQVALVQQRLGPGTWACLAIRRGPHAGNIDS